MLGSKRDVTERPKLSFVQFNLLDLLLFTTACAALVITVANDFRFAFADTCGAVSGLAAAAIATRLQRRSITLVVCSCIIVGGLASMAATSYFTHWEYTALLGMDVHSTTPLEKMWVSWLYEVPRGSTLGLIAGISYYVASAYNRR